MGKLRLNRRNLKVWNQVIQNKKVLKDQKILTRNNPWVLKKKKVEVNHLHPLLPILTIMKKVRTEVLRKERRI